jgi:hypothetical protein
VRGFWRASEAFHRRHFGGDDEALCVVAGLEEQELRVLRGREGGRSDTFGCSDQALEFAHFLFYLHECAPTFLDSARVGGWGWWDAGRWGPIVEFQNVGISVGRHDALDFKLACEVLAPFLLAAFSPFSAKKENNPNNTEVRRPGPRIDVVLFQFGLGFGFPWNVADAPSHFLVNGVLGSFMALCRALEVRLSPFLCVCVLFFHSEDFLKFLLLLLGNSCVLDGELSFWDGYVDAA